MYSAFIRASYFSRGRASAKADESLDYYAVGLRARDSGGFQR